MGYKLQVGQVGWYPTTSWDIPRDRLQQATAKYPVLLELISWLEAAEVMRKSELRPVVNIDCARIGPVIKERFIEAGLMTPPLPPYVEPFVPHRPHLTPIRVEKVEQAVMARRVPEAMLNEFRQRSVVWGPPAVLGVQVQEILDPWGAPTNLSTVDDTKVGIAVWELMEKERIVLEVFGVLEPILTTPLDGQVPYESLAVTPRAMAQALATTKISMAERLELPIEWEQTTGAWLVQMRRLPPVLRLALFEVTQDWVLVAPTMVGSERSYQPREPIGASIGGREVEL